MADMWDRIAALRWRGLARGGCAGGRGGGSALSICARADAVAQSEQAASA